MVGGFNRHSEEWRRIEQWAKNARTTDLANLCTRGLDPAQTESLRGRISALDELLALPAAWSPTQDDAG